MPETTTKVSPLRRSKENLKKQLKTFASSQHRLNILHEICVIRGRSNDTLGRKSEFEKCHQMSLGEKDCHKENLTFYHNQTVHRLEIVNF